MGLCSFHLVSYNVDKCKYEKLKILVSQCEAYLVATEHVAGFDCRSFVI